MINERRNINEKAYQFKKTIDLLMEKSFFQQLLIFYRELESLDGMKDWMSLYNEYLINPESCPSCISGKLRLLEKLIFDLNESKLLNNIDELCESKKKYIMAKEFGLE